MLFLMRISELPRRSWRFLAPSFRQVLPFCIHRLNQGNLLLPGPALDFLFPADRGKHIAEDLVIRQPVYIVPAGEARRFFVLMLQCAFVYAVGDTGVKCARKAGENVDLIKPRLSRHSENRIVPSATLRRHPAGFFGAKNRPSE